MRIPNWNAYPVRLLPQIEALYVPYGMAEGSTQADIFLVTRRSDRRQLVVKQYRRQRGERDRVGPSLLRAISKSNSPRLVQLVDFGWIAIEGTDEWVAYEVQEHLPHRDLGAWLQGDGNRRLVMSSTPLFDHLVEEMALALMEFQALRGGHSVHRDVKPSNFFIADPRSMNLKLGDYGVALDTDLSILPGNRVGTERYLPPEADEDQFRSAAPSDWWALGMIVAEMALGHHPIESSENWPAQRRAVVEGRLHVEDIADERRRQLVRGLLHPAHRSAEPRGRNGRAGGSRWTGEQVLRWVAGENVPVDPRPEPPIAAATRTRSPFSFEGRNYASPEALVRAMHLLWREAVPKYAADGGRFHTELVAWFDNDVKDGLAASVLSSADRTPPNRLAKLGSLYTPLEPRYRDIDLRPLEFATHLAGILDDDAGKRRELQFLFDDQALRAWASESNDLGRLDHEWRRLVAACERDGIDALGVHAEILMALVDPAYANALAETAEAMARDTRALSRDSFRRVATRVPDPGEEVARHLALVRLSAQSIKDALHDAAQDRRAARLLSRVGRFLGRRPRARPAIVSFEVQPARVVRGGPVEVRWRVIGAERVEISAFGSVPAEGRRAFVARASSSLTLRAYSRSGGERIRVQNLAVEELAVIDHFGVSRAAVLCGDDLELRWSVRNAGDVRIVGVGVVPSDGTRTVTAQRSGTFEMRATNLAGTAIARTEPVHVLPYPPVTAQVVPVPFPQYNAAMPLVVAPDLRHMSATSLTDDPLPRGTPVHGLEQLTAPRADAGAPVLPVLPVIALSPALRRIERSPVTTAFRWGTGATRPTATGATPPGPARTRPVPPRNEGQRP